MNASDIRATIPGIERGQIDPAVAALQTTGARTEAARQDVRAALERHWRPRLTGPMPATLAQRAEYQRDTWPAYRDSLRQAAVARIQLMYAPVIEAAREAWLSCGYRETRHGHTLDVRIGVYPHASSGTREQWPSALDLPDSYCRGTVTTSAHTVCVRSDWQRLARIGLAVVDGLFTLAAERVSAGVYRARWVRQSRGTSLRVESGYLVRAHRNAPWVHVLATSQPCPAPKADPAIAMALRVSRKRYESNAAEFSEVPAGLLVTWDDAAAAGLCVPGCKDWLRKRGLPSDTRAIPAHTLLRLAQASGDRVALVRAAISQAMRARRAA